MVSTIVAMAQDVIVMRDGSLIQAKVERVTKNEIVYRKASNPNGPQYTVEISEVLAINYENGEKDSFDTGNTAVVSAPTQTKSYITQETASSYSNDSELIRMYWLKSRYQKKAKTVKILGCTLGPGLIVGGGVLMLVGIQWDLGNDGLGVFISGAILAAGGIATTTCCLIASKRYLEKLRRLDYMSCTPVLQHEFALTGNSSLSLGVDAMRCNFTHTQTLGLGMRLTF